MRIRLNTYQGYPKLKGERMKHIQDLEEAWKCLNEWCDITSRLSNDGAVMVKEMERLKVRTLRLIGGKNGFKKDMGEE